MKEETENPTRFQAEDIEIDPWTLPEGVSKAYVSSLPIERLYLSRVMRMLGGVGAEVPDCGPELLLHCSQVARAAKPFFEAVGRGEIILRGARPGCDSQPIPVETFVLPYWLVSGDDDAIGPDLDRWPTERAWQMIRDLREYDSAKWGCVTVDRASLAAWVAEREKERNAARPIVSDDDAKRLIREAISKNDGFIGQKKGARIVLEKFPHFGKKRAMALVKGLTGNDRPGPKGPRRNRAG